MQRGAAQVQIVFGAAVQAMKRILVDYARKRDAIRRGGGMQKVSLSGQAAGQAPDFEVMDLHRALERLSVIRPRAAQVVEYRFLLGLNVDETAEMLEVSPRTVDSDWRFARAWISRTLEGGEAS